MEREQADSWLSQAGVDEAVRATLTFLDGRATPPVWAVQVSSPDAVSLWQDLARAGYGIGWPVIIGSDDDRSILTDIDPLPASETLAKAAATEGAAFLRDEWRSRLDVGDWSNEEAEEFAALAAEVEESGDTLWLAPESAGQTHDARAPFDGEEFLRSSVAEGYRGAPRPVWIALTPASAPHDAPAFVSFGRFNDCPPPDVHVALHRRWAKLHGAEIFALSGDVIEARVRRPPQTKTQALALALEQYLYCPDIVEQGTQTVRRLADDLQNRPAWFFWWD